jgi:hypothetical protein
MLAAERVDALGTTSLEEWNRDLDARLAPAAPAPAH